MSWTENRLRENCTLSAIVITGVLMLTHSSNNPTSSGTKVKFLSNPTTAISTIKDINGQVVKPIIHGLWEKEIMYICICKVKSIIQHCMDHVSKSESTQYNIRRSRMLMMVEGKFPNWKSTASMSFEMPRPNVSTPSRRLSRNILITTSSICCMAIICRTTAWQTLHLV